jgi:hypothetical protein
MPAPASKCSRRTNVGKCVTDDDRQPAVELALGVRRERPLGELAADAVGRDSVGA